MIDVRSAPDPQIASEAAGSAPRRPPPPPPPPPPPDELGLPPVRSSSPGLEVPVEPPKAPAAASPDDTDLTLDPAALQFLLSPAYQASNESAKARFGLSDEQVILISDLDRLVMAKRLDLDSYLVALEDELGAALSQAERDELYAKLLSERFAPLGSFLQPTAEQVASAEGLKLSVTKKEKIESANDDEEIAKIREQLPAKPEAATALERALDTIVGRVAYRPSDDYLAKRLRNIISSRLRDVRSALEFRQLLMRDTKVGGLGLDAKAADDLAKEIEASYQEFHEPISTEEKKKIDRQLTEQKRKIEERRRREAEEHAKWFEEKIRARKAGEAERYQAFDVMRRAAGSGPTSPLDLKEHQVEKAKFGPLIPQDSGGVKVSPPTLELAKAKQGERPTLDALSYAGPQLMGLLGELGTMSVPEFRRLAKNPEDAAKKIQELVEALGQESFDQQLEGMRVFRQSPLQAAYLALISESFRTGVPVATLAKQKREAGEDTLSPEEIAAVIKLNSALHF